MNLTQHLFEIAPELFEFEVEQLADYKRLELEQKHNKIFQYNDKSLVKGFDRKSIGVGNNIYRDETYEFHFQMKMEEYKYQRMVDRKFDLFIDKFDEYFGMKMQEGIMTTQDILEYIRNKPEEQCIPIELEAKEALKEFYTLWEDFNQMVELNHQRSAEFRSRLGRSLSYPVIPEYIKGHPILEPKWIQLWKKVQGHGMSFDQLMEMHGPPKDSASKQYDNMLKNMKGDIDRLIDECKPRF